ncbi:MAG TPA: NUDIX hydrolase [Gemmatimonadaceae bacterium]
MATLRHTRYQAGVIRDGCVLLVQCSFRDGSKWWMLPGGGREEDEDETTCVAREVLEECGVVVHVDRLLSDVAADPPDGTYVRWRTYRCTVVSGEPRAGGGEGPNAELIAIRWLPLDIAQWSDDITADRFLYPQLIALRVALLPND